jgi:hypothetical protein
VIGPGLYLDMDSDSYFADPCDLPSLTQSGIPTLLDRSPMHFAYEHPRLNPYGWRETGDRARWLGSAVHRLALGRGREISVIRYRDYASADARRDRDEAVRNGRIPVLERDLTAARDMARILRGQIEEACEGHAYVTEAVMIWKELTQYGEIWCRGMLDVWCPAMALALDPKALRISATPGAFGRAAADAGYDVQAVFYRRGLEKIFPELKGSVRFVNLVVESAPPHGAQMFEPDPNTLYVAERQCAKAMELFARCLSRREWPGYPHGVQTYSSPAYHQNKVINS